MLLGVAAPRGSGEAAGVLARVAALLGPPRAVVGANSDSVLSLWPGPLPALEADGGFVAEGWLAWSPPPRASSFAEWRRALRDARGDFSCIAVADRGLLVGTGSAGGYRPLYAAVERGTWIVTTSLRALVTALRVPPEIDRDGLAARLTALALSGPSETPFRGVERLAMGHAWELCAEQRPVRVSLRRRVRVPEIRELDAPAALRAALDAAVSRSMAVEGDVGVLVSGGVDSSAVAAIACDQAARRGSGQNVQTFALDFETGDPDDDRPYRRALLKRVRARHFDVHPEDAASAARASLVLDAQPLFVTTGALILTASRLARAHGTKVMLTGLGGDTVLDGRPGLFSDLLKTGKVRMALSAAARLRGPPSTGAVWRIRKHVLKPLVAPFVPAPLRRSRRRRLMESEFPWKGPALQRWFRERTQHDPPSEPGLASSPIERYNALAETAFMADLAITRALMEGGSGCAQRDPLLDDDLLATIAGIPPLALLWGGWRRGLLRHSVADLVPDEVRFRTGKAYLDPAVAQMVSAAGGLATFADLADVRMLADLGLAEPKAFRQNFDRLAANPDAFLWWSVWPALAGEAFLRQHATGTWQ